MSSGTPSSSSTAGLGQSPHSLPSGKGTTTPPKVTQHDATVELKDMKPERAGVKGSIPIGEDVMQIARIGEIAVMQKMFDEKKSHPNYKDEEGITPLHWAAINNQYAMCKFLLDSGADVNAKGGESVATPAMWAAQRCHYYIVHLLLQHGADPLLTDVQGYNILHLATIDGNAFLLVLLLHQEIPVDVPDQQGHTGLMWAAYKGFPACVDLFLRWGANANAVDDSGLTPLHWALVKGSLPCVQKLIEYGADRFAKTRDGKTPATVAGEMNTTRVWYRALDECGYDFDGNTKVLPFGLTPWVRNKSTMSKFFFLWPFLMIFVAVWVLSNLVVFAAIPIMIATAYGLQWLAQKVASQSISEYRILQKTPYLSGVFAGSLFWVGVRYIFYVLPATYTTNPISNICFALFFSATTYFYFTAMIEDPGFVPKLGSRNQQRTVIAELFEQWKFDEENFCVACMIRKPLRSKHCKRCGRCVAKHDHHCPWIDNCVGANNLRHFVLYITCLEAGIILFVQLTYSYINVLPAPVNPTCNVINDALCDFVLRDTFTLVLDVWVIIQLVWVTMLCAVQLVQISRNQTTYENMRGHSIDRSYPSSRAFASALAAGTTSLDAAGLSSAGQGPNPALAHGHRHRRGGCLKQWTSLLGIDAFFATARDGLRDGPRASRAKNPFSRGVVTNCRDFWCDPAPYFGQREAGSGMLGGEAINYNQMYEMPSRMHSGGRYRSLADEDPERNA
ncbi:palmitoyltransferase akr1 [Aspergillus tubingensis]|uniref:Palmitoyltransferase n=4 Tax=Aspergillus subgen. Circumdati TaxID=2720871 RepID=A0A100ITW4_ASPNG|nr:palmitoyltransferase SidR [Aspergillus tubingensis]GAQ47220.1 palmitoyltransferase [Aspergillus niger]GFN12068.1 palmitoyltransferase SidR [Aspergillus tubingensis]GLA58647.1 palmitoyltransferase akr1 [Aspergillus tubingensis]GLA73133.1 palmitoyltransferase akr1 [Aspergillus tubingensis]GLA85380.1 palmitoyltransferase akr1 [Aspergillus tubingensis]